MFSFDGIWHALLTAEWAAILRYGVIGALAGAVVMPLIVYIGMRTNQDRMRENFKAVGIPEGLPLYGLFALAGAGLFGVIGASQPVLDAAGENEVYVRGALLVAIMLILFPPFARALRRLRNKD